MRWPRLNSGSLPSVPAWRCAHWSNESFSAALKVASNSSMRGIAVASRSATRVRAFGLSDDQSSMGPRASSTTACTNAAWLGK